MYRIFFTVSKYYNNIVFKQTKLLSRFLHLIYVYCTCIIYREWHSQVANKPAVIKKGSALQKKLVSSINNTCSYNIHYPSVHSIGIFTVAH